MTEKENCLVLIVFNCLISALSFEGYGNPQLFS